MTIKQSVGSEVPINTPGFATTFYSFWNGCQVPSQTHFFGTVRNSRASMCPGSSGPFLWPPAVHRSPDTFLNHVLWSITNHLLSLKKKNPKTQKNKETDSLELLQFTFFLGIQDFFWCLSIHHFLRCLPRPCLGFGDVSSPHGLLWRTSHRFWGPKDPWAA